MGSGATTPKRRRCCWPTRSWRPHYQPEHRRKQAAAFVHRTACSTSYCDSKTPISNHSHSYSDQSTAIHTTNDGLMQGCRPRKILTALPVKGKLLLPRHSQDSRDRRGHPRNYVALKLCISRPRTKNCRFVCYAARSYRRSVAKHELWSAAACVQTLFSDSRRVMHIKGARWIAH